MSCSSAKDAAERQPCPGVSHLVLHHVQQQLATVPCIVLRQNLQQRLVETGARHRGHAALHLHYPPEEVFRQANLTRVHLIWKDLREAACVLLRLDPVLDLGDEARAVAVPLLGVLQLRPEVGNLPGGGLAHRLLDRPLALDPRLVELLTQGPQLLPGGLQLRRRHAAPASSGLQTNLVIWQDLDLSTEVVDLGSVVIHLEGS
mmetsp:Transcript_18492/g.47539  ORF Transcript_18492/g.47539 Transcript_18492/m.47539 type:complete len:203 (+) Transcript_18492:558-1166(+)